MTINFEGEVIWKNFKNVMIMTFDLPLCPVLLLRLTSVLSSISHDPTDSCLDHSYLAALMSV